MSLVDHLLDGGNHCVRTPGCLDQYTACVRADLAICTHTWESGDGTESAEGSAEMVFAAKDLTDLFQRAQETGHATARVKSNNIFEYVAKDLPQSDRVAEMGYDGWMQMEMTLGAKESFTCTPNINHPLPVLHLRKGIDYVARPTAVILAAGEGKRMGELAKSRPKAMIKWQGVPIIQRIFDSLGDMVEEAVVVIGKNGQCIVDRFGDRYKNMAIKYAAQPTPSGTTDALTYALPHVDSMLLMWCDIIFDRDDIAAVVAAQDSILYSRQKDSYNYALMQIYEGRLTRMKEKPEDPRAWRTDKVYCCNAGLAHLSPEFVRWMKQRNHPAREDAPDAIAEYAQREPIRCIEYDGRCTSLGTLEEMEEAYKRFSIPHEGRSLVWTRSGWISKPAGEERPLNAAEEVALQDHYRTKGDVARLAPWTLDNQ